ncbi:MAG TPA: chemotaxis protein CheX [Planctomycetota bacterium]
MEIVVVGPRSCERVKGFETFAKGKGCTLLSAPNDEGQIPAPRDQIVAGIVLFEETEQTGLEWLSKAREQTRYLNMPVIVVRATSSRESQAKWITAGASAVCESGSSPEDILLELRAHSTSGPVMTELREKLLGPFCAATITTMREMAGIEIVPRCTYQKTGYRMFGDISAVLGLLGRSEGSLVLSFPEPTAEAIVKHILSEAKEELSPGIVRDCIGEISNVIAGQARGQLMGTPYEFVLSTPTVISGTNHEIRHKPSAPCLVVAFRSEVGEFALQLCMSIGESR